MYSTSKHRNFLLGTAAMLSLGLLSACDSGNVQSSDNNNFAENSAIDPVTTPGSNSEFVSEIEDRTASIIGTLNAELTESAQGFVEAASFHNMYEKAAAEIALERSLTPEINAFAREVITENRAWGDDLAEAVRASTIPVELPKEIDARHVVMIDNLAGASDEDFNARYADQQVNANKELLTLCEKYVEDGLSLKVREFASVVVPTVKRRLVNAEILRESISSDGDG